MQPTPRADVGRHRCPAWTGKRRVARRRRSASRACVIGRCGDADCRCLDPGRTQPPRPEPTPASPVHADAVTMRRWPSRARTTASSPPMTFSSPDHAGGRLIEAMTPGRASIAMARTGGSDAIGDRAARSRQRGTAALPDAIAQIGANRIISDDTMIAGASYGIPAAGSLVLRHHSRSGVRSAWRTLPREGSPASIRLRRHVKDPVPDR